MNARLLCGQTLALLAFYLLSLHYIPQIEPLEFIV